MRPCAVFRCDANPTIGGGHVMRCLTLAEVLANSGWEFYFACGAESVVTVPALAKHQPVIIGGSVESEPAQIAAAIGRPVDWLLVDHYQRGAAFETACRAWASRVLAIDDLADRLHDCDLLLDQTVGRCKEDYAALVPADCRLLLGTKYALLRPQFAARREESIRRRSTLRPAQRLLMSFGMTDPHGIARRVLKTLLAYPERIDIDVVAGTNPDEALVHLASDCSGRVTLHGVVEDMASLMLAADLAVGLVGSTAWERCALGLPSVVVISAANQGLIAGRLAAAGVHTVLGEMAGLDDGIAAVKILDLARNPERLARMSQSAFAVCDGEGGKRVASKIVSSIPIPA